MVCTLGLPRTTPTAFGPYRSTTARTPAATASKASSQVASRNSPSLRTSGLRSRSGSPSTAPKEAPLGQMNPLLNTSSRSPRAPVTRVPSMVSVRPQVASHRGQIRRAVRDTGPPGGGDGDARTAAEHTDRYARRGGLLGGEVG